MSVQFMTADWAEAAKDALNAGPDEEARTQKIEKFWEWIDRAAEDVNCTLGLGIQGADSGSATASDSEPDCLLMKLEQGKCTDTRLVAMAEAEQEATYLLAGDLDAWREILGGYDMGRTIMYRKLVLERGNVLEFFRAAYYWTESLACIQRVPTTI